MLHKLTVLLAVGLLFGCASTPNYRYQGGALLPDKGLLVASVTREIKTLGNRHHTSKFFIRHRETGEEFRMTSQDY